MKDLAEKQREMRERTNRQAQPKVKQKSGQAASHECAVTDVRPAEVLKLEQRIAQLDGERHVAGRE